MKIEIRKHLYKIVRPENGIFRLTQWEKGQPYEDMKLFDKVRVPITWSEDDIKKVWHEINISAVRWEKQKYEESVQNQKNQTTEAEPAETGIDPENPYADVLEEMIDAANGKPQDETKEELHNTSTNLF